MKVEKPHSAKEPASGCYRCGQKAHKAAQCPYKEAKCHFCGKVGHLKKVCRSATKMPGGKGPTQAKVKQVVDTTTDISEQQEYHLFWTEKPGSKPFKVTMLLDAWSNSRHGD